MISKLMIKKFHISLKFDIKLLWNNTNSNRDITFRDGTNILNYLIINSIPN